MAMNDFDGLAFCTKQILKSPDPRLEFRQDLHKMSTLKNVRAIPWLLELLFLGKQPEYRGNHFNSLESVVIDTLYNIGIDSDENFIFVKAALLQFMTDNEGKLEDLNFYFTIQRMEEQLSIKKLKDFLLSRLYTNGKSLFNPGLLLP